MDGKHKIPYSHLHSFVSTTKRCGRLEDQTTRFLLLLYVNSLKKFFEQNNCV